MPCKITVKISANAGRNEIVEWQGGRLKIRIKAPAIEGKANDELVRFLAKLLRIHRREITIEHGETSTIKLIALESIDAQTLHERLGLQEIR